VRDFFETMVSQTNASLHRDRPTLLSLNRFEGKKNVELAVKAYHLARQDPSFDQNIRLVIGGEQPKTFGKDRC
jgi:glycosyltransferase involved in cell wall biosynthesis